MIARLGGVRINERYAGDAGRSFEPLPAGTQREAMRWLLSRLDDLEWLDSRSLIVGEGLNPGIADFIRTETFDRILGSLDRIALCASLTDGEAYTRAEALDDLSAYLLGQCGLGGRTRQTAAATAIPGSVAGLLPNRPRAGKSKLRSDYFAEAVTVENSAGFAPLAGVSYLTRPEDGHLLYGVLLDCRDRIAAARNRSASPQMRGTLRIVAASGDALS